ncbi:MAG TPA: hypothetical protein DCE18_04450 [Syntrophobacteraceae bacterium]|nr:hypothetical protein [Syntrophobacteraceae bacterium]HBZ56563.1 hypothetical protein [Syntrophobacteraceae bacterium]
MADNRLFNISSALSAVVTPPPGGEVQPPVSATTSTTTGVITAQQSAITFAGAPAAVTLVWKVTGYAVPALATSKLFPIVLSLVVGMLIYWQSATFTTRRDKVLGFVFALINSFAIAAATLGIDTAAKP